VFLNKNGMVDNIQKHNICMFIEDLNDTLCEWWYSIATTWELVVFEVKELNLIQRYTLSVT
jgi:hypothetical protein